MSFARVGVSSGARPKQVKLDSMATETLTGDLIVPEGFRFSVECKAVNKDVDLLADSALLDKFLEQAAVDADSIGKMPLLCWKRNRKGWIVALPGGAEEKMESGDGGGTCRSPLDNKRMATLSRLPMIEYHKGIFL